MKKLDFVGYLERQGRIAPEVAADIRQAVEPARAPVGRLLVITGAMTVRQVVKALAIQADHPNQRFGEIAIREDFCSQEQLEQALQMQRAAPKNQPELVRRMGILEDLAWTESLVEYCTYLEDVLATAS